MSGIFSLNTPHAPEKNKNAIKNNEPNTSYAKPLQTSENRTSNNGT